LVEEQGYKFGCFTVRVVGVRIKFFARFDQTVSEIAGGMAGDEAGLFFVCC
jgi:hypothetical protein